MIVATNVDKYFFVSFSDLTCYPADTGIGVFWLHYLIVGRPNFEEATAGKKTTEQFHTNVANGSVYVQIFPVMWIFTKSLGIICYNRQVLSEDHENCFKDKWGKVFKNEPSKICGRQLLKNVKRCGVPKLPKVCVILCPKYLIQSQSTFVVFNSFFNSMKWLYYLK